MRALALAAAALLAACALAGCGDEPAPQQSGIAASNATEAYKKIHAAWKRDDARSACAAMSTEYRHKLQAILQVFDAGCPMVVTEIHKRVSDTTANRDLSIEAIDSDSVLVRTKLSDDVVRTRFDFTQRDGQWVLTNDQTLDATGPTAPVAAYKADVPKEKPEVLWSEIHENRAYVWEIQGNGRGTFTLIRARLQRNDGKWSVVKKENIGTAPVVSSEGNEVV